MMKFHLVLLLLILISIKLAIGSTDHTSDHGSEPMKILIKAGILYDINNAYLVTEIKGVLQSYVANYGLSGTHEIQTTEIYQLTVSDIVHTILDAKLTAVFVASRRVNCTELGVLFQTIPFFFVSGSSQSCDSKIDYNRVIYMFPSDSTLMSTMLSALTQYEWSSAAVLYEENDEVQYTFQDMQEARNEGIEITAFEAKGSEESIREKLIQARRKGSRTYILVCSYTRLRKIMTIARELRLSTSNNHWFIPNVLLNPHVLHEFLKDGVRITFLHSPIVTSLTLDLLTLNPNLNENGHELFSNIVKSLTRIAMRSVVDACSETTSIHPIYNEADGDCFSKINIHGSNFKYCGPDFTAAELSSASRSMVPRNIAFPKSFSNHSMMTKNETVTEAPIFTTVSNTKRVDFDEACIIYTINKTDITDKDSEDSAGDSDSSNVGGHHHGKRRKRREMTDMTASDSSHNMGSTIPEETGESSHGSMESGGHGTDASSSDAGESGGSHTSHDVALFEVAANFNPCPYKSIYQWNYIPETCTATFFQHLSPLESNSVFIVEHIHVKTGENVGKHELIAVGGFNNKRHQVSVTYPPFKISHIILPEEDFTLGVVWNPPWLSWEFDPVTKIPLNGSYTGFLYDLIVNLATTMGFNFTIYEESAIEFGKDFNHTDEELESRMNFLFDNDTCDMFLFAKTIHGGRILSEKIVGITTSFQQPKMYLLTKRVERDENVSIWQFLTPFRDESWISLYMSLLTVSLLMTYINKKNPNEFRRAARDMREGAKHSEHMGIMNSLWFNFASLVEQSSQLLPRSASLKFFSGVWWFFVMLVVSAYTANMISFMTQSNNAGITTLEELVSQQEFDYGMLENNAMLTKFLPEARDQPYSLMWDKINGDRNHSVPISLDDALTRVNTGSYIFIASYKELVQAITGSCDYDKVGDGFYKYQYGLPVPLGWQFLPKTNDYLQRLYDDGTISGLEAKWFDNIEARCETNSVSTTAGQLDLKAFIGMYVLLILGVTGGIIVCIFETSYIKYGGIKGFMGKANKYEFRKNHTEHQKPDKVMEQEFEKWTGGWEVIKHRPFLSTVSDMIDKPSNRFRTGFRNENSGMGSIQWKTDNLGRQYACCAGCGHAGNMNNQEENDLVNSKTNYEDSVLI